MATTTSTFEDRANLPSRSEPMVLSQRPLSSMVWELAWPVIVLNLVQTVNTFVDRKFISALGTDALAGSGVGMMIVFIMMSLAFALGSATTALVARFYGASDLPTAKQAMNQCVRLAVMLGLLVSVAGFLLLDWLIAVMMGSVGAGAQTAARQYLIPTLFAIPAIFVGNVLAGSLRAIGDTRAPMYVMSIMVVIHIAVSWVLIFGHLGAPRLGLPGASTGFAVSVWVALFLYMPVLRRRVLGGLHLGLIPDWEWVARIVRIAYPTAIQTSARTLGMSVFTGILARTPQAEAALATLNIGMVIEGIAFMPGFGYAMAAAALVGQSLGAKVPEKGERLAWIAGAQACAIMTFMAIPMFVFAEPFARIFTSDPAVLQCTMSYLKIAAISQPPLAFLMVLMMALQGAGDTFRAMLVAIFAMWVFRVPLTYVWALPLHGGADAAWWSMTIATFLGAFVAMYVFHRGKWKHVEV